MTTIRIADVERVSERLDYASDDWSAITRALLDRAIEAGESCRIVERKAGHESDAAAAAYERVAAWEAAVDAAEQAERALRSAVSLVAAAAKLIEEAEEHHEA